jgi:hypothetical protein
MRHDVRLDGLVYRVPLDKFTGRTLEWILQHKEGPEYLKQLKVRLEAMGPLRDPNLLELLAELRVIEGRG